MDKLIATTAEAVARIRDGASIAFGGFGVGHTSPTSLLQAIRESSLKELTFICNSLGLPGDLREQIAIISSTRERAQGREVKETTSLRTLPSVTVDVYNASGEFVTLNPGAFFFDSVASFEIARGNKLDAVVLGAYQVDRSGNLANFATRGRRRNPRQSRRAPRFRLGRPAVKRPERSLNSIASLQGPGCRWAFCSAISPQTRDCTT